MQFAYSFPADSLSEELIKSLTTQTERRMFFKPHEELTGNECIIDDSTIFVSTEVFTALELDYPASIKDGVKPWFAKNDDHPDVNKLKVTISIGKYLLNEK